MEDKTTIVAILSGFVSAAAAYTLMKWRRKNQVPVYAPLTAYPVYDTPWHEIENQDIKAQLMLGLMNSPGLIWGGESPILQETLLKGEMKHTELFITCYQKRLLDLTAVRQKKVDDFFKYASMSPAEGNKAFEKSMQQSINACMLLDNEAPRIVPAFKDLGEESSKRSFAKSLGTVFIYQVERKWISVPELFNDESLLRACMKWSIDCTKIITKGV